jgi:hypothetical protein
MGGLRARESIKDKGNGRKDEGERIKADAVQSSMFEVQRFSRPEAAANTTPAGELARFENSQNIKMSGS